MALETEKEKHANASEKNGSSILCIYDTLCQLFKNAIQSAYPDLVNPPVIVSLAGNNPKFGDYQCNSALPISKILNQEKKVAPNSIANNIVAKMAPSPLIERLEVAGPGFINIFLSKEYGKSTLNAMLKANRIPAPKVKRQRVVVDFSSPNIAKEMHVGHLRSTIIGESISRILEYLGHDVLRLNHVGDWGTQFGMLIAHLRETFPNYLKDSPPIEDLQSFYKESKLRFDSDEEFKKRAYKCVVQLQAFEPDITKAWQLICDVSRKEFQKLYNILDVTLVERGESFYQKHMENVIKELEAQGLLEVDEQNRKIMHGDDSNALPAVLVKSDGGFLYHTSDMASIKHRIDVEKADWLIYVVDAGQSSHFKTLASIARRAKILTPRHRFDHVAFGVIQGEDKKRFKTRSGETVKLIKLLEEGVSRSEKTLLDKGRDKVLTPEEMQVAKEAIAYSSIKYADLSHDRLRDYVFSFDRMLEDKGNTAVYLLYALTRIRSIARTANVSQEQIQEALDKGTSISVDHEKEWKLAKVLIRFPDVILKVTQDFYLHQLCEYCYEVACTFTEFYDKCFCVAKDKNGEIVSVNMGRILLTEATARILEQCFTLLGLKAVSKM